MTVNDIFNRASWSLLLKDPYVANIWELVQGDTLFKKSPDQLAQMRGQMTRDCLSFFVRHNPHYIDLFDRLEIDPKHAGIEDLAKLAIPSDMLRGDGQNMFLIKDIQENGETFQSSGTTGEPR